MIIQEAISKGILKLKEICDKPRLESELLLCDVLKQERVWIHLNSNYEMNQESVAAFLKFLEKRATHYPLEYITQKVSFYSKEFHIAEGVLIPRPETEILVDIAKSKLESKKIKVVAEVGVGSGVISLTLAPMFPNLQFIGSDINPKAIELAKKNAKLHNIKNVEFRLSSKLDEVDEDIDVMLSNPPYIEQNYQLPRNVAYEPKEALFGGEVGDEFVKDLIDLRMKRGIPLFICEFGFDQKESIKTFCSQKQYNLPKFYTDLGGFDRGFVLE